MDRKIKEGCDTIIKNAIMRGISLTKKEQLEEGEIKALIEYHTKRLSSQLFKEIKSNNGGK